MLAVLTATSSRQSFMKHEQVLHARKCKYFWIYPKITFAFVMDYSEQIFRCMYAIDMILQLTIINLKKKKHPKLMFFVFF